MSTIMDFIMAGVIFGVLVLTVARTQVNLNSTLAENTFTVMTQGNAVQLAQQIEFDFLKMGYKVQGPIILQADTSTIQFRAGFAGGSTIDTPLIKYSVGTKSQCSATANVNDFPLFRQNNNNGAVQQNLGVTKFYLRYYDANNAKINTPISGSALSTIRSIFVQFTVESPSPVVTNADTVVPAINWQKLLYPRNLGKLF
jgi:hypothetical protein